MSRFVAFDQETTGLDPRRDRIVSIGAVAVADGGISLDDVYEAVIQTTEITPAVLIHGITPAESRLGITETEAVEKFLTFIGGSTLVGHHVGFDRAILLAAAARAGRNAHFEALDTMRLTLALVERGALTFDAGEGFSLDALCQFFHIPPHGRHTAPGDAYITAQVFVRLLRLCERHGLDPLDHLEPNEET